MAFQCNECGATFRKMNLLQQHQRNFGHRNIFVCDICNKTFGREDNLRRHYINHQDQSKFHCLHCGKSFNREDNFLRHQRIRHNQYGGADPNTMDDQENHVPVKRMKLSSPNKHYDIKVLKEVEVPKFRTKSTHYKVTFNNLDYRELPDVLEALKELFQSIIRDVTEFMNASDLIRVSLQCPDLDYPIALPFSTVRLLTPERIMSEIERVLQSYEEFTLDDNLDIDIIHVALPVGGVGKRCNYVDLEKMLKDKRCFIRILNKDNLCCARAIITAKAKADGHEKYKTIRMGRRIQEDLAKELHRVADVPLQMCGLEEIKKFQNVLQDYQVNVLSKEHFNALIYSGPEGRKPLYIYHHDNHYDVITSMPAFLNKNYFCTNCKSGYDRKAEHACNNSCSLCRHIHDEAEDQWMYCESCNRSFKNPKCYELHAQNTERGISTCKSLYKCKLCNTLVNKRMHEKKHQCGETYCKTCKEFVVDGHECYMKIAEMQSDGEDTKENIKKIPKSYIFFDFECTQEDLMECDAGYDPLQSGGKCRHCEKSTCGSYVHHPNLCVVQKVCGVCMQRNIDSSSVCVRCGKNEMTFEGDDTVNKFCKWLFSKGNYGAKVICHNFKGYDSFPIMQYLYENGILPEVITTGTKFMSVDVPKCKIRFLDSLNFLPMPLAELPDAFGINELQKGYFPHLFNRKENWNVCLSGLPDAKFYNPNGMKPDKRRSFMKWYDEHRCDAFVFQNELLTYCRSDVDILRRSCLKFRELFMDITSSESKDGIDPFEHCITIASACNLVFRTLFLEQESIGIIPSHGYRPKYKQSVKALQWLKYMSETQNINIQHAFNGGEKQIGPYHVDGYFEKNGEKVVLEFHGDFWHGCPKCFSENTINPITDTPMSELYQRTMEKRLYIERQGYRYESIWECDFDRKVKENRSLKSYVDSLNIGMPLEPRDAFYGGRTEAFKLYTEATSGKKINYYDVTSLYPYINKVGKIPVGHPEIITENFEHLDRYEGLIKCTVLPPRGLHIPALPYRANSKLLFPLCRTCADTLQTTKCFHSDSERAITGTWVTDELKQAIRKGYKLMKIDEIWHFSNISQYDPRTKTGGLFSEYVNTFLKIKQQASGWPKWCKTEELKQKYINDYFEKEGIFLDYDKIEENPGLRRLAKLMLNSFWGKFGQRTNLVQNKYITNPLEYFDMLTSDSMEVKNVRFVSNEMVQMDWVYRDDFILTSERTNVVIAAYTTAQARLKLQNYLDQLGTRVCYCDTDSIVFTTGHDETTLPLGDYLGDLTDEVAGNEILTFVTAGPKNYAYITKNPNKNGIKTCCKVRGITLNFENSLKINFETIKALVKKQKGTITVVDENKIARDKQSGHIITKTEKKDYKIVFDKRVIGEDYATEPYGM